MNERKITTNQWAFLEELRSIAQLGLHYTDDTYDRARYERLLELASVEYGRLSGLPSGEALKRFQAEIGHVTPKVGVDAAIFSEEGWPLLVKRSDDLRWCLPCGWADLGESAQDAMKREVREETGLEVEVGPVLEVGARLPGEYGPHTLYFLMFHCVAVGGSLTTTEEAVEVDYFDPETITEWHAEHGEKARLARRYWLGHLAKR